MTHAFDPSATEHAWWAARDMHRISTAALLREALPALGLCATPRQARIAVTGDGIELVMRGVPAAVVREVLLVPRTGICFAPPTVETSLGQALNQEGFCAPTHGAVQRHTVRTGAVADTTLTLPMLLAARALRPVAAHIPPVSAQ